MRVNIICKKQEKHIDFYISMEQYLNSKAVVGRKKRSLMDVTETAQEGRRLMVIKVVLVSCLWKKADNVQVYGSCKCSFPIRRYCRR